MLGVTRPPNEEDGDGQEMAAYARVGRRLGRPSEAALNRNSLDGNTREMRRLVHLLEMQNRNQQIDMMIGESPLPDPGSASTPAEFVAMMKEVQAWSGLTYRELEERAGPGKLPKSTLGDALRGNRLPRLEVVVEFLKAAGVPFFEIDRWDTAWRRLNLQKQQARRAAAAVRGAEPSPVSATNDVSEASIEDVVVVDTVRAPGSEPQSAGTRRKRLFKFGRRA